jgi:hypothetical protein
MTPWHSVTTAAEKDEMKRTIGPVVLAGMVICAGCTHTAKRRDRIQNRLDEHSRALTTAVVDTLQLQPVKDEH